MAEDSSHIMSNGLETNSETKVAKMAIRPRFRLRDLP